MYKIDRRGGAGAGGAKNSSLGQTQQLRNMKSTCTLKL